MSHHPSSPERGVLLAMLSMLLAAILFGSVVAAQVASDAVAARLEAAGQR